MDQPGLKLPRRGLPCAGHRGRPAGAQLQPWEQQRSSEVGVWKSGEAVQIGGQGIEAGHAPSTLSWSKNCVISPCCQFDFDCKLNWCDLHFTD